MNLKTVLLLATLVLCGAMNESYACGEVMHRAGGTLRYHAFVSRHPAQILLYAGPAANGVRGADPVDFSRNLERAGHKVTVAGSPETLAQALAARAYDVLIAQAGNMDAVDAGLTGAAGRPALIPVYGRDADARALRDRYPLALGEDAGLNGFLKEIEKTMKTRGT